MFDIELYRHVRVTGRYLMETRLSFGHSGLGAGVPIRAKSLSFIASLLNAASRPYFISNCGL